MDFATVANEVLKWSCATAMVLAPSYRVYLILRDEFREDRPAKTFAASKLKNG